MKKFLNYAMSAIFAISVLASCSTGGGGGVSPFDIGGDVNGGGGGTNNADIVGKWTSVSLTGTVEYTGGGQLGPALSEAINQNLATYDMTGVTEMQFDAGGKMTLYDLGAVFLEGTWSVESDGSIKIARNSDEFTFVNAPVNGEITHNGYNTLLCALAAWAMGDAVLRSNDYKGMEAEGIEITKAQLIIKYKKK
ncbi:MAG: hypothetical protein LBJ58_01825 [Tannerellaceae bacterium]|nr:hypothetical protein [Tannerellaceae bacterium]